MHKKPVLIVAAALFGAATLSADFSFHETSRVTGGAIAGMLKVAGVFSKQAREPIESDVAYKGDRMARRSQRNGQIVDLGAGTVTMIDFQKKSYTVMTFEQMREMLENAMNRMKQNKDQKQSDTDMSMKVSAKATGNSRQINGYDAKEMAVIIDMEATDKKSGQSGTIEVTSHVWIASGISGAREMREFSTKMAQKLNWSPGSSGAFLANPDVAKGMAQAYKEIAKLDGTPVVQTLSIGPPGSAPPDGSLPQPAAQEDKKDRPSLGGALGGALGGKFGLGKKKNNDQQKPEDEKGAPAGGGSATLIDMTTEYSNFAQSVDASMFEIPAGFKKVEPDLKGK